VLVGEPPGYPGKATWALRAPRRGAFREQDGIELETFQYPSTDPLQGHVFGDPSLLRGCRFAEADCPAVPLGADTIAVGVGALGRDFDDCQDRFGEFLAAAGVAAYLPTDGSNVPDYLLLGEATAANVRLCYGLSCTGQFAHLTRFETRKGLPVTLTNLVTTNLDLVGTQAIGLVLIAESAGLMGAALRRSPVGNAPAEAPFGYPAIREWLSFTAERAYRNTTALVVGVATREEAGALAPLLRPLGRGPQPVGHFHAAVFSHRTLPIGEIDLKGTVAALFEAQHFQGCFTCSPTTASQPAWARASSCAARAGPRPWGLLKTRGLLHDRPAERPHHRPDLVALGAGGVHQLSRVRLPGHHRGRFDHPRRLR
jgi:hypothetical protein